jgi:DNA topoisomerase-3
MISRKIASREMSDDEIKQLLETGRTDKITDFKSKANKNFSAVLTLDSDFKTKFEF